MCSSSALRCTSLDAETIPSPFGFAKKHFTRSQPLPPVKTFVEIGKNPNPSCEEIR